MRCWHAGGSGLTPSGGVACPRRPATACSALASDCDRRWCSRRTTRWVEGAAWGGGAGGEEDGRSAGAELAAAVEVVHAYSLVPDDLPSMADDDLRRGRPPTHPA